MRGIAVAALGLVLLSHGAAGQTGWVPRLRLDNDAYNFWIGQADRPDEEYTNGVHLTLEAARAPWWGRHFAPARRNCAELVREPKPCLATAISMGQDMYTPRLDRPPYTPRWELERPFFGWLYLSGEARVVGARSLRTAEVTFGVTGRPAGGEVSQKLAHAVIKANVRPAIGWETQVGFEPGLLVRFRQTGLAAMLGGGTGLGFDLAPSAGVALGNILTEAEGGAVARLGWNLSHPWDVRAWTGRERVEGWFTAGARGAYVAHNMSVDGNTIRPTRQVERVPRVWESEFGAGLRIRRLSMGYSIVTRSREYTTGPARHTYSSMQLGLEVR